MDKQTGSGSSSNNQTEKVIQALVVEDNASNFFLISRLLESHGFHCEWKTSGFEVVEFADALSSLDLILLDIMLPYEDGYAAYRKIRQNPKLSSIPIVAVTALSNQKELDKAKLAGFNGFIGKPLNPDKFFQQISKILSGESVWELNK